MRVCEICGDPLEADRAGSRFDRPCNEIVNPTDRHRRFDAELRIRAARELHRRLRGGQPGWGRFLRFDLASKVEEIAAAA